LRYVEGNALQAGLVERAQDWRWSSLWARREGDDDLQAMLSNWPVAEPTQWLRTVNRGLDESELEAVRQCVQKDRPYGGDRWMTRTAAKLGLESSLRSPGRPRKKR